MGKIHENNHLGPRLASRSLLGMSLAASLAALGCTTNLNPGSGAPTRVGPELHSAPTSGITSGSERATPPPMTSSYTRAEAAPVTRPRPMRRSAAEAAAIMAGRQVRGRYLGVVNPGPPTRPYVSGVAAYANPGAFVDPQVIVSSAEGSASTSRDANATAAEVTREATTAAGAARPPVTESTRANPTVTSANAAPSPAAVRVQRDTNGTATITNTSGGQ